MLVELLSVTVIGTPTIAFLVACFRGFSRALPRKLC